MNTTASLSFARRRICFGIAVALAGVSLQTLTSTTAHATPPQVTNCDDSGPGSLRAAVADPGTTAGAVIDLSALTCSVITLTTGPIQVTQNSLTIVGRNFLALTISGAHHNRVFTHAGHSTLALQGMTIADGAAVGDGGCIAAEGNVLLSGTIVKNCTATHGVAGSNDRGGGLYTVRNLELFESTITGNVVGSSSAGTAQGGGALVGGTFVSTYSTVSDNKTLAHDAAFSLAGGVQVLGGANVKASTFSGNSAGYFGAIEFVGDGSVNAYITNSTVSHNTASAGAAAIGTKQTPVDISNATIVANATIAGNGAGQTIGAVAVLDAILQLHSSIISGNEILDRIEAADVTALSNGVVVGSADNFVSASNVPIPGGTRIGVCRASGQLAVNGGSTLTHAVLQGSFVINRGAADPSLTLDQRDAPRQAGGAVDIGAVERQDGEIDDRLFASAFEPACDI